MTAMRLSHNLLAVKLADKLGVNASTISRYECGRVTLERADLTLLENFALACEEDKLSLFSDYMLFRRFQEEILELYLVEKGITRSKLGQAVGVSKQLALSWLNKENRSPSRDLWEREFKDITERFLHEA